MENVIIVVVVLVLAAAAVLVCLFMNDKCVSKNGYVLVPCSKNTVNLVRIVKSYYWDEMFEYKKSAKEIIIVLIDDSANSLLARKLEKEFSLVSCVEINSLVDFLKQREEL